MSSFSNFAVGFAIFGIFLFAFLGVILARPDSPPESLCTEFVENPTETPPSDINAFMAFDRAYGEKVGDTAATINRLYCKKHGYNFRKFPMEYEELLEAVPQFKGQEKIHVWCFARYACMKRMMESVAENAWIVYLDGDAACVEHDRDLRMFLPKDPNTFILIGNEVPHPIANFQLLFRLWAYGILGCCGVLFVRNNEWTRSFVDRMLQEPLAHILFASSGDQGVMEKQYKANQFKEKQHIKVISMLNGIQHHQALSGFTKQNPVIVDPQTGSGRHKTAIVLHTVSLSSIAGEAIYKNPGDREILREVDPTLRPIGPRKIALGA